MSRSAKHLHSSEEQLMSLAGSLGYVAPEVLNHKGHGKPVDLWAIGCAILPSGSARCNEVLTSLIGQDHHLRASLRILSIPVGRYERARATDDRSQNHLPRPILEQRVRRR